MPRLSAEKEIAESIFSDALSLAGAHHGTPAFVIGNGLSVKFFDTDKMGEKGIVLGCNLGFKMHKLDYLCWQDTKVSADCATFKGNKVTSLKNIKKHAKVAKRWFCFNYGRKLPRGFEKVHTGGLALQLAILMECDPIFLVGCDGTVIDIGNGTFGSNVFTDKGANAKLVKVDGKKSTPHLWTHAKRFDQISEAYKEYASVFQMGDWGIVNVPHVDFPEFYSREHPKKGTK